MHQQRFHQVFLSLLVLCFCVAVSGCSFFNKESSPANPSAAPVAATTAAASATPQATPGAPDKAKPAPTIAGPTVTTPHGYRVQVGVEMSRPTPKAK